MVFQLSKYAVFVPTSFAFTNNEHRATFASLLCLGLAVVVLVCYLTSPWCKLPPGPTGLPIIGNALQLTNTDKLWLQFSAWRKEYGDIFSLNAAGQPIVVVNSHKIATELLDRRASIYSDRPRMIVASEILCGGLFLPFIRWNDKLQRMRKAAHESLHPAQNLHEHQTTEALLLARAGLQDPGSWDSHVRRSAASMMLSCIYDEPVVSEQDDRVSFINAFAARVTTAAATGAHWVELLPWMRKDNKTFGQLFGRVQEKETANMAGASMCATLLRDGDRHGLDDREKAWLAAAMYAAGTDPVFSILLFWSLAMLVYPEVQKRAQEELDTVVGHARVPTFADMPHLPYIRAMVKEIIRWSTVIPLGVPHRSTQDDYYESYFIPKGTIVIVNAWELNHDRDTYGDDAHDFNPARHLDENGNLLPGPPGSKEEGHFTFGFGRRICVGKAIANNSLFIDIATCLWAFSLTNPDGQKLDVDASDDDGLTIRPKAFNIDIRPRYPEAISLLSHECELRGQ